MQSERAVESCPSSIIGVELVQSPFGDGYTLSRCSDCWVHIYPHVVWLLILLLVITPQQLQPEKLQLEVGASMT